MKPLYKVFLGILISLLVVICGAVALLSTESVQQWIYAKGIEMLSEKLKTRIVVDKITVDYWKGGVALFGFEMDDRQHVPMLKVDTLEASLELWPLLFKEVDIDELYLHGAKAVLYKEHPDTASNYQFVLDAFKKKKKKKESSSLQLTAHLETFDVCRADFSWDVKSLPRKGKGQFDHNHLAIHNFSVAISGDISTEGGAGQVAIRRFNASEIASGAEANFKSLVLRTLSNDSTVSALYDLHFSIPGKIAKKASIDTLIVTKKGALKDLSHGMDVTIRGFNYWCNNFKPRKNKIKPHRGAFDPGHLNSIVNARIAIHKLKKDTLSFTINSMDALDRGSGLDIRSFTADVEKYGNDIFVKNSAISLAGDTHLQMAPVHITLHQSHKLAGLHKAQRQNDSSVLTISPFKIKASTVLKDISKPFAPVLSNFTTPLKLSVTCCGDLNRILFKDIVVTGLHKSVIVHAQGDLCDVAKGKRLNLHFWDIKMSSRGKSTEKLVGHFAKKVNLKMQRQMRLLGNIRYNGYLGIFFKRVDIGGTLFSKFGDVTFDFTLNGFIKYMIGTLQAKDLDIGKLMNVKKIKPITVKAEYSFSTARKKKGNHKGKGKLPKGTLFAQIDGARYGIISMKHITADFKSDGSTATGTIIAYKKLFDIAVDVTYHQTVDDQSMHYKVHLLKHHKKADVPAKQTSNIETKNNAKQKDSKK